MTLEDLKERHKLVISDSNLSIPDGLDFFTTYEVEESNTSNQHTNLSIEFAMSMLEELKAIALNRGFNDVAYDNLFYLKIQELKQQLNK